MKNRIPTQRDQRPPLPDFAPVPRKCARHDGWTPERQRAFIEALADTGSVARACAMVNMTAVGAYYLRRQPGADEFRRAWAAALDFGVARMKDIAFERAVEGTLVPVIAGGKLLGYRRIYNDRLLMFCLRHYGEDAQGRRTRVEYFSTRASAGAASAPSAAPPTRSVAEAAGRDASPGRPACAEGDTSDVTDSLRDGPSSSAEASTTTVRTVITGGGNSAPPDLAHTAALIESFDPAELDPIAHEQIARALAECAARRRETFGTPDDEELLFLPVEPPPDRPDFKGNLVAEHAWQKNRKPRPRQPDEVDEDHALEHSTHLLVQPEEKFRSGPEEMPWEMLGDDASMTQIEDAVRAITESKEQTRSVTRVARRDDGRPDGGA